MQINEPGFYKTRDGRKVHVVHVRTDGLGAEYPVIGYLTGMRAESDCWRIDGKLSDARNDHVRDIVSEWTEPKSGTYWLNVDADGCKRVFDTLEEANSEAYRDRIACVRVDWTEGDGL